MSSTWSREKKTKTWVSTGMFKQVGKKIGEKNIWDEFDWVIQLPCCRHWLDVRLELSRLDFFKKISCVS